MSNSQDSAPVCSDQFQDELNSGKMNPAIANNLASLIDERINNRISLEMKKVSQMLIENLSVFVKKAAKLSIEQDIQPELNKLTENFNIISKKLECQIKTSEKLSKE